MFIAFEGPDNVGKSTSAARLDMSGQASAYNITKALHAEHVKEAEPDSVVCYDRIDWFTHMVYRLALPDRDWNDDRPRTVFAMPDTHLVVKLHHPQLADFTADEVVDTPIGLVNPTYFYFADFFTGLNEERDFALFKSITLIEVVNTKEDYSQRVASFSSPVTDWAWVEARYGKSITDMDLLELLNHEDSQRI